MLQGIPGFLIIISESEIKLSVFEDLTLCGPLNKASLTLILLTWTIWRAPSNASKWRMGFNPYPANVDNMASSFQC